MNIDRIYQFILYIYVLDIILIFSDGCDPLVYRVLDDHRRSIYYKGNAVSKVYKQLPVLICHWKMQAIIYF